MHRPAPPRRVSGSWTVHHAEWTNRNRASGTPLAKRWFTWALDKLMGPTTPVTYWSAEELTAALRAAGFEVRRHAMLDFLPYPHVLYIATRRS